jgi:hypothetical protein
MSKASATPGTGPVVLIRLPGPLGLRTCWSYERANRQGRGQFHVEPEPLHEMLQPLPPVMALPEF